MDCAELHPTVFSTPSPSCPGRLGGRFLARKKSRRPARPGPGRPAGDPPGCGPTPATQSPLADLTGRLPRLWATLPGVFLTLFGFVFGACYWSFIAGEWAGAVRDANTGACPAPRCGCGPNAGYPVFRNVVRARSKGRSSHTPDDLGVLAAIAVGEWATVPSWCFFMRVGDYARPSPLSGSRRAVKDLAAWLRRRRASSANGVEREIPIAEVRPARRSSCVRREDPGGRRGRRRASDGGQAAITGESMRRGRPGREVFAASLARLGSLRVRATHVGPTPPLGG